MSGLQSLKKKRRIQLILALMGFLISATVLIGFALKDGINLFRSPTQVIDNPPKDNEIFRLGGLVKEGSIIRSEGTEISFIVHDGAHEVPVVFNGILPDLFSEEEGMVGTGQLKNDVFVATEILAKHDETYMPQEVVDALKEQGVYQGQ